MAGKKRPEPAQVAALLRRYHCPTPLHAVRARFMGCIASPARDRSTAHAIQEIWGGEFPPADSLDELNHLLHVLADGLWNRLIVHQTPDTPFRFSRVQLKGTRQSVLHYAQVREQEMEGFTEGLFGRHEELELPENAHQGMQTLEEVRGILIGVIRLLEDPEKPATPEDLVALAENLQRLASISETELNVVILSCTRARQQALAAARRNPTVH